MLALPNLPPKTFLLPSLALGSRSESCFGTGRRLQRNTQARPHLQRLKPGPRRGAVPCSWLLQTRVAGSLAPFHYPASDPMCVVGGVAPGLTHAPAHLEEASASPSPTSHILAIRQRSKRGRQLRSKNHSHVLL